MLRAARGTREGLGGLRRRETGRALEAGLREDRRQLGAPQGVDEGVDGRRAGRRRRRLRGVHGHDLVAGERRLAGLELLGVRRLRPHRVVLGQVDGLEDARVVAHDSDGQS